MAGSQSNYGLWLKILIENERVREQRRFLYFPQTETGWDLRQILTEKVYDDMITGKDGVYEASGLALVTQTSGPPQETEAILRIRMQIPPVDDPSSRLREKFDYSKLKETEICWMGDHEIDVLQQLTEAGCSCTPKLIDHVIVAQSQDEYVPGGYIAFILMEKLPGRNLENFHTFSLKKRDEVRISFLKSMRELFALGYKHLDPCRRNLMWDNDTKRCFVVGIEDFHFRGKNLKFIPRVVYGLWDLRSKHDDAIEESDDPMIPSDYEEVPLKEDENRE
ncbi:hypothetical protein Plec18167_004722 [Paecilomyces lecythidis]|uniref:Protein kinase domain-containing protein n=1 Tax=Paecilomyces lecythidis TaxID=3004212 RepID=A0ABR3XQ65_9EURO